MIYYLKFWKELTLIILVFIIGVLVLKLQSAKYDAFETKLIHEKLISEAEAKEANIVASYNRQRQLDAEKYANEINSINYRYANLVSTNNRVQQKVTTYNSKLHTVTREALETYGKTASILFGECTKEYIEMGKYTAKLDAELDSLTKASQ